VLGWVLLGREIIMKHGNSKPANSPYQRNINEQVALAMVNAKLKASSKAAGHAPQMEEPKRVYCGDRERGCGAELTQADMEAGFCTQCREPLTTEVLPLEQALLMSLAEVESQRVERKAA
jgi:hypothetical protein